MKHKVRWWSWSWNSCPGLLKHRTAFGLLLLFSFFPAILAVYTQENDLNMPHQEVEYWANKMGSHIFSLCNSFAQYDKIKDNFVDNRAEIRENDGLQLVKEMASDVTNMMKFKVDAVKRIMNVAEEASLDTDYKKDEEVEYFNAKRLNRIMPGEGGRLGTLPEGYRELELVENLHFGGLPVNENVSSVHVPTNVYDKSDSVIDSIRWSGRLDRTFKSNYELDPTLSWQYFGSSTGFLRQYPAAEWVMDERDPDLYDARLRTWYIEAANSPKDMVVLLDMSGSMTGLRKEIAKHVVLNILETLNENDYVNVFTFSTETLALVPCFNDTLVQANLENLGEFKKILDSPETKDVANFSQALTKAFELLQRYNRSGLGSQCNQAIMLVTDGSPDNYKNIFEKYNWPHRQVRMFTYLIGREETKVRDLNWMACANKGYFVHVTTLAEVREQVLKYIPVMARPMVMYQAKHPHTWTGVYADIADPKQTEWLWEVRERKRQMDRTNHYRELKNIMRDPEKIQENSQVLQMKDKIETYLEYGQFGLTDLDIARIKAEKERLMRGRREAPGLEQGYRLMTSVSVPVFDRKKTSVKTANLLGVAGTDVPIREIEKLVPPYKLGVNGYSFMVNTNGYILYHPDLRPVFQDILKPNYNSVDFAEVELVDDDSDPRANNTELLHLRRDMIEQRSVEQTVRVKIHMDDMKRVVQREQRYFTQGITGTPFSLGIATPVEYGKYKVYGQIELSLELSDPRSNKAMDHFSSGNWTLHPDWVYCEYKYDQHRVDESPEELMKDFLSRAQKPLWKWRSTRTRPPPEPTMTQAQFVNYKSPVLEDDKRDNYYCDKDLVQSLLFDARTTNVYATVANIEDQLKGSENVGQGFGITTIFVATRSGLTRWVDLTTTDPTRELNQEDIHQGLPHFMNIHNRAIDEVWYKRAVDYYAEEDRDAFVYSVPFDAATRDPNDVMVTATRAIFIEENKYRRAPAAVVGVTIRHRHFVSYFKNETYKCPSYPSINSNCKKTKTCESKDLDCYLLDDNGFIVVAEKSQYTGQFFGTLEGTIMESLVQSEVYKRIRIFDYQAVCLDSQPKPNPASIMSTPIQMMKWAANWMMGNIFWVLVRTHLYTLWDANAAWAYTHTPAEAEYPNLGNPPPPEYSDYQDPGPDQPHALPPDDIGDMYDQDPRGEDEPGDYPNIELAYINKTKPRPCDKEAYLYKLQNDKLKQDGVFKPVKGKLSNCHTNGCGRPFSVQKVRQTNLILVAVNNQCPCESRKVDIQSEEVDYDEQMLCKRLLMQHYRKRPEECFNYHPDEEEIKLCGGAGALGLPSAALFTFLCVAHLYSALQLRS